MWNRFIGLFVTALILAAVPVCLLLWALLICHSIIADQSATITQDEHTINALIATGCRKSE